MGRWFGFIDVLKLIIFFGPHAEIIRGLSSQVKLPPKSKQDDMLTVRVEHTQWAERRADHETRRWTAILGYERGFGVRQARAGRGNPIYLV